LNGLILHGDLVLASHGAAPLSVFQRFDKGSTLCWMY